MSRRITRILCVVAALVVVSFVVGGPASADDLTVNPDEVVRADPGSTVTVAEEQIPADLVGLVCDVRIATTNGSSVHPGNVVITSTGGQTFETPGVEDSPEGKVDNISSVTLGETLVLQMRMGDEGLSSLGFTVAVDCPEPAPEPVQVTEEPEEPEEPEESEPTVLPAQQVAPPADPVTADPTFTG